MGHEFSQTCRWFLKVPVDTRKRWGFRSAFHQLQYCGAFQQAAQPIRARGGQSQSSPSAALKNVIFVGGLSQCGHLEWHRGWPGAEPETV